MKLNPTPTMSREEAVSIYNDLHHAMQTMIKNVGSDLKPRPRKTRPVKDSPGESDSLQGQSSDRSFGLQRFGSRLKGKGRGVKEGIVVMAFLTFGILKGVLGLLEYFVVSPAMASIAATAGEPSVMMREGVALQDEHWTKAEADLLRELDARRVQLEKRSALIDAREEETRQKEQHLTVRLAELKDLTSRLKSERVKDDKKKEAQLSQLANVYGAMAPADAAVLLDQIDIQTARSLIERMPEKRIGQLLPLMKPDRALTITQMLSGRSILENK